MNASKGAVIAPFFLVLSVGTGVGRILSAREKSLKINAKEKNVAPRVGFASHSQQFASDRFVTILQRLIHRSYSLLSVDILH